MFRKKTFTVSGLKKSKKISAKDIYSKLNIQAAGLDNYGSIYFNSKSSYLNGKSINIKHNCKLKNSDIVKITLPNLPDGYVYSGPKTFSYKVSGLITKNSILNAKDFQDKMFNSYLDHLHKVSEQGEQISLKTNYVVMLANDLSDNHSVEITSNKNNTVKDNYTVIFEYHGKGEKDEADFFCRKT